MKQGECCSFCFKYWLGKSCDDCNNLKVISMWKYIIFYCIPLFTVTSRTSTNVPVMESRKDTCITYVSYTNRNLALLRYKLLKEDNSLVKLDSIYINIK